MGYEKQIIENAKAIQEIKSKAKSINQLDPLSGILNLNDKIPCYIDVNGKTVYATFQEILNTISLIFYNQGVSNKIPIITIAGQTEILLASKPSVVYLYKEGVWQIQYSGYDFSYNNLTGLITLFNPAEEGDFFEVVVFGGNSKKLALISNINNQIEFTYGGNYNNVDVYIQGSRLIENIDYTRTYLSENNKIILTNGIDINTLVEVIIY